MTPFRRALVLTTRENLALTVIRSLSGEGIRSTVGVAGAGRLLRLSRHCAGFASLAPDARAYAEGGEPVVEAAARLVRSSGADLIFPVDVPGALLAGKLRPLFPGTAFMPFADAATLKLLDNKWSFYELLRERGLPAPRTWLLENAAQAKDLPLPLVLKPLSEAGGVGVEVARDAAARDARLAGTAEHLRFPTLAQEFVDGEDVSLSFLADRGRLLAWSVHMRLGDGAMNYIDDDRAVEIGRRLAEATGYTGYANVDMRYDGASRSRVLALECNPRVWGTFKYTLGLGVDYLGRGLDLAAGRRPPPFERAPVGFVPGMVESLKGLARGASVPAASRPYLRQKFGDPAPELYYGALHLLGLKGDGL